MFRSLHVAAEVSRASVLAGGWNKVDWFPISTFWFNPSLETKHTRGYAIHRINFMNKWSEKEDGGGIALGYTLCSSFFFSIPSNAVCSFRLWRPSEQKRSTEKMGSRHKVVFWGSCFFSTDAMKINWHLERAGAPGKWPQLRRSTHDYAGCFSFFSGSFQSHDMEK